MNANFRKRAPGNVTARISESPAPATGVLTQRKTGNVRAHFRKRNHGA